MHLTLKPTKKFAEADGHLFMRPEKMSPTKTGRAGAEIDVGAAYTLAKGLKLGRSTPSHAGQGLYPVNPVAPLAGQVDPIHYLELELRYDL